MNVIYVVDLDNGLYNVYLNPLYTEMGHMRADKTFLSVNGRKALQIVSSLKDEHTTVRYFMSEEIWG